MKQLCISVMVALMVLVFTGLSTAQSLTLQLASGSAVVTIADNSPVCTNPITITPCDSDPTVGNIRFVGAVGSFTTNITVGNSIPALIELGSTDVSRTSGTLTITLAQKGLNVPAAPQTLTTSLSGGFSGPAGSSSSVNFLAGANAGNASPLDYSPAVIPSGSVCVGDVAGTPSCTNPLGPFTTSSFNSGGTQTFTTSGGLFSIFNQANITVSGCSQSFSCRVNVNHSTAVMGYVAVAKQENGSNTLTPPKGSGYVFQLRQGASATAAGLTLESLEAYAGNPTLVFASQLTPGVTYNICETLNANVLGVVWSISNFYNPGLVDTVQCVDFVAQGGTTVVVRVNNQLPPPKTTVDTTPPVIVPQVTGILGNNGWYRSNVSVAWSVTDPESGIASSTGCVPITQSTDTAGVMLTCTATNGAGLSASASVTIKIDKTPPVTTATPSPGALPRGIPLVSVSATGTVSSTTGTTLGTVAVQCFDTLGIVVKLNAVDNAGGSGVATLTYAGAGPTPIASNTVNGTSAQISITAPGMTTLTFAATDMAGNREGTKSETAVIIGVGEDGVGFACALPTPNFTPPQHGKLAAKGTVTVYGFVYPFSKTITF